MDTICDGKTGQTTQARYVTERQTDHSSKVCDRQTDNSSKNNVSHTERHYNKHDSINMCKCEVDSAGMNKICKKSCWNFVAVKPEFSNCPYIVYTSAYYTMSLFF